MASAALPFIAGTLTGSAEWSALVLSANTLLLLLGGLLVRGSAPRVGRMLALGGIASFLFLLLPKLTASPASLLLACSTALLFSHSLITGKLWFGSRYSGPGAAAATARGAAIGGVFLWVLLSLTLDEAPPRMLLSLALSHFVVSSFGLSWLIRRSRKRLLRGFLVAGCLLVPFPVLVVFWGQWWTVANLSILSPLLLSFLLPGEEKEDLEEGLRSDWWGPVLGHPERLLAMTFLLLCICGSILLALPLCSASGAGLRMADAVFTAVSAVCVTGLVVLDTPVDFSPTGQGVILLLMQLGGLGIMTFSTVAMQLFGRRMSLRYESALAGLVSVRDRSKLFVMARTILFVTLGFEGVGALVLLPGFSLMETRWEKRAGELALQRSRHFAMQDLPSRRRV